MSGTRGMNRRWGIHERLWGWEEATVDLHTGMRFILGRCYSEFEFEFEFEKVFKLSCLLNNVNQMEIEYSSVFESEWRT